MTVLALHCCVDFFQLQTEEATPWLWFFIVVASLGEHRLWGTLALVAAVRVLSSCGAWASLSRGTRDPPAPGIKPMSAALAGGLFITESPGKPWSPLTRALIPS